jgi:hypothetical protein
MDRRHFFKSTHKRIAAQERTVTYKQRRLYSGLTPYSGSWTVNEAAHLLKRTMFGAKKTDIDYLLTLTPAQAVDELLTNINSPSPPVRDYGLIKDDDGVMYDDLGVPQGKPG